MTATRRPRTLFVNAWSPPSDLRTRVAAGECPCPDYLTLIDRLGADMLDLTRVGQSRAPRLRLALAALRESSGYDVVLASGEDVGLPLALLKRMTGRRCRLATIVHVLTTPQKRQLVERLQIDRSIDRFICHAETQVTYIRDRLGLDARRVHRIPFQVDHRFFSPSRPAQGRLLFSAGLEQRDYDTLLQAVGGFPADVVIAADSPGARRGWRADGRTLPPNVRLAKLAYRPLRDLYDQAAIVVVPLLPSDYQAGITTILEAMAMARPVIVSHTAGQTETVVDGKTGLYVPPQDPAALRQACSWLLDRPSEMRRMGSASRAAVEAGWTVDHFVERIGRIIDELSGEPASDWTEHRRRDALRS